MFWFMAIAAAMSVVQGVMQYQQLRAAGNAARDAGKYQNLLAQREAASLEQQAGQKRAESQQAAILQRRRGQQVQSRHKAFTAASGALDEGGYTEGGLIADTDFNVLSALYAGEEAGRGLEDRATITRAQGEGAQYAGQVQKASLRSQANQALIGGIGSGAGIMSAGYTPTAGGGTADFSGYNVGGSGSVPVERGSGLAINYGGGGYRAYAGGAGPYGYR